MDVEVSENIQRKLSATLLQIRAKSPFFATLSLYAQLISRDDIDTAMTIGVNYPKGLLKWADEIGVKSVDNQLKILHSNSDDDRYKSSPLLIKMGKENTTFYA